MVFVLDQLIEITSATPETPHEKNFQDSFKDLIASAKQALVSPPDYQEPMESITKLKQLHQVSGCSFFLNLLHKEREKTKDGNQELDGLLRPNINRAKKIPKCLVVSLYVMDLYRTYLGGSLMITF